MIWLLTLAMAGAAFGAAVRLAGAGTKGWLSLAAAIALGFGGFALQVRPDLPGAPAGPGHTRPMIGAELVSARRSLGAGEGQIPDRWTMIADAMTRNGQYGDAAGIVRGAIEHDPQDADAWLALANNLVAHADGRLTPAARYAYRRAALADPGHPGPAFFTGLALAADGQPELARRHWADLLAHAPGDAPWRGELERRLRRLDAVIAAQAGHGPVVAR